MHETAVAAPDGLGDRAVAYWREVVGTWDLDPAGMEILRQAVEALDQAERARAAVAETGMHTTDRYGSLKPNPLLATEDKARGTFLACMRALALAELHEPRGAG